MATPSIRVALEPIFGDGRGDEADDDQGHAEHDELVQHVFQSDDDGHDALRQEQAEDDAHHNADQQLQGEAHALFLSGHKDSSLSCVETHLNSAPRSSSSIRAAEPAHAHAGGARFLTP